MAPAIGVSWAHGTDIGIASSPDGTCWLYRGTLRGLEFENGRNTFWAPEVLYHDGIYHMYCSYVKGIPSNWKDWGRDIVHYTSTNLWDWDMRSVLKLSSNHVIDACVFEIQPNLWKMWYKDELNGSHTFAAVSHDLDNWEVIGPEITDCPHEGPNVFSFKGRQWLITDPWEGLGVYSSEDFIHWTRRKNILYEAGTRTDDGAMANHADVLVHKDHAYIFYFVHPGYLNNERKSNSNSLDYSKRRSSLQVAELKVEGDMLTCDRNNVQIDLS
jgi:hypothetical protein